MTKNRHPVSQSSGLTHTDDATPGPHADESVQADNCQSGVKNPDLHLLQKKVERAGRAGMNIEESSNDAGFGAGFSSRSTEAAPEMSPTREETRASQRKNDPFSVMQSVAGRRDGVYFTENGATPRWLCSPLFVTNETRDDMQQCWGRQLTWRDKDGAPHSWSCPAALLAAKDASDVFKVLADGGLELSLGRQERYKLLEYIMTTPPGNSVRLRSVSRLGWHGDHYVLPDQNFGPQIEETLVFQGSGAEDFAQAGTVAEWRQHVAAKAVGNTRLVFALSVAFAGPLALFAGECGGVFHFVGGSSIGKTGSLLEPAASVWGPPDQFGRKWRATGNALEASCVARNDNVVILDELAQVSADEAGSVAYMIANGQAKARMNRDTSHRSPLTWRVLVLSAGEIDLAQHMAESGKTARGGQMVRMVAIPADAGQGMGTLENLHGHETGQRIVDELKASVRRYHGTAGRAFLVKLTQPAELAMVRSILAGELARIVGGFNIPTNASPEVRRVASRFALVAFAGSFATQSGLTGWPYDEAEKAAQACFSAWLAEYGGGTGHDQQAVLRHISSLLQMQESRFAPHDSTPEQLLRYANRLGFRRGVEGGVEYLVQTAAFKQEFCKGYERATVINALKAKGWLKPGDRENGGKTQRNTQKVWIHALNKAVGVYVLSDDALDFEG